MTQPNQSTPTAATLARDNPGVIMQPPFLYAGFLIAAALIDRAVPLAMVGEPARWILAAIFFVIGFGITAGGTRLFRRAGTNIETHKPSTTVVTHGLYKYSRNPIYLGLTAIYVSLMFVANTWWALILLPVLLTVMRYGVIAREERYLEAKFGDAYTTYKARVRRWL